MQGSCMEGTDLEPVTSQLVDSERLFAPGSLRIAEAAWLTGMPSRANA
jgi:hypothetical protein